MAYPMLRLHDGFAHTSPDLKDEVQELQKLLVKEDYSLTVDGLFGRGTEEAVVEFQKKKNLDDDGIVGPVTWAALLGKDIPEDTTVESYSTTYSRNDSSLLKQLNESEKYKEFISEAAKVSGASDAVIWGIGSRESHWGLALKPKDPAGTGDFAKRSRTTPFRSGPLPPDGGGFGRGLMQIDYDAHEFARGSEWKDPKKNILYGAKVLRDAKRLLDRRTSLKEEQLLRAAAAAYNSGAGNVLKAVRKGLDVDFYTAGRDYSRDVFNRAGFYMLNKG